MKHHKQRGFIVGRGGPGLSDEEIIRLLVGVVIIVASIIVTFFAAIYVREILWLSIIITVVGVIGGWALGFWYMMKIFR